MKIDFSLRDLNRSALEKLVEKLLSSTDSEEQELLDQLGKAAEKESSDLADLKEEKKGKPTPIDPEEEPTPRKKNGATA
jgi:hypothetical protein